MECKKLRFRVYLIRSHLSRYLRARDWNNHAVLVVLRANLICNGS